MNVATKLRVAFGLYITLLAALLIYHVSTIQRVVQTGEELIQTSSRVRATSMEQVTRIPQIAENAAKAWVTRDPGYVEKYTQLVSDYSAELIRIDALPLSEIERDRFSALQYSWNNLGDPVARLNDLMASGSTSSRGAVQLGLLQNDLDSVLIYTQELGEASQEVMSLQLENSAAKALAAERLSWISALGVIVLSIALSALLARSISEPLKRLTVGTREVAAGQFDYRLNIKGDDEFASVARDFNFMTARLGELDQMKRDFVSQVSHDLKTPLSSMQETINLLLDGVPGPLTDQQSRLLHLHQQSAERLSSMLAKLLDLSKIESGMSGDIQLIDVSSLVNRGVAQMESSLKEREIAIHISLPEDPIIIEGDSDRVLQLIDNLLENAIKFSPQGGAIEIAGDVITEQPQKISSLQWNEIASRSHSGGLLFLTVSDQGPGVPDSQKDQIFSRFFQGDAGKSSRRKGVGLGLTICSEIVATLSGKIWVSDNEGGGSIFNVLIPGALSIPNEAFPRYTARNNTIN